MKRVLLVCPSVHHQGTQRITPFWLPPLALATVGGLFGSDWDVQLVDENVQDIPEIGVWDLVFVTAYTANSARAYALAKTFRQRGMTVVLGGAHVSVVPDEAAPHADAVVIGDAEHSLAELLADWESGRLKARYQAGTKAPMACFAAPRRDLFAAGAYLSTNSIQASRGCPHVCSFCSIASRYDRRYGKKAMEQLIVEIAGFADRGMPVFFVDDNIFVDRQRSKEFLRALIPFKLTWWSQADITIMHDEELLALAKESGCLKLVVGFETVSQGGLAGINKHQNDIDVYYKFVETVHRHGVLVNTSFCFGNDSDGPDVFEKTLEFLRLAGVMFATFNILTPLPGTQLYREMLAAGRIVDHDWAHYDMGHVVFEPRSISREDLKAGYNKICGEFYGSKEIFRRIGQLEKSQSTLDTKLILNWNLGYKRMLDNFGVFM